MKVKEKNNYKYERDLKKEKIMLRTGAITKEEIRRLWYEEKNIQKIKRNI